jgi:hypothetical protein
MLREQGFLDHDAIDIFIHVMFLELAWNTVLHSDRTPGAGYGIIGAQIFEEKRLPPNAPSPTTTKTLQFCIADSGLGIPNTLRAYYAASGKSYESQYSCSTPSAIVRCAMDPDSSCRMRYPSDSYAEGYRGLARVAEAIKPSGRFSAGPFRIISGCGSINLKAHDPLVSAIPDDTFKLCPIPGTHVSVQLRTVGDQRSKLFANRIISEVKPDIWLAASLTGTELRHPDKYLQGSKTAVVIIDVGYCDHDVRTLEGLVKAIVYHVKDSIVVFWNLRSQLTQLRSLESIYHSSLLSKLAEIQFVPVD